MEDQAFRSLAEQALTRLVRAIDDLDPDTLDVRRAEGALHVEREGRGPVVLSRQVPLRELWLAADRRAWHFRYLEGGAWRERDSGEPLEDVLSRLLSALLDRSVAVPAP